MFRVYTYTGFKGHYPVGTAAVIVARSPVHAARLLTKELEDRKLSQNRPIAPERMSLVDQKIQGVEILNDENY